MVLNVSSPKSPSRVTRALPTPVTSGLSKAISLGAARFSPEQRLMAERNMRRVLGPDAPEAEVQRTTQKVFDSYARYWVETLEVPHLNAAQVDRGFTDSGLNHLPYSLERGLGPILALPHVGGWEWSARLLHPVASWQVAPGA